MPDVICYDKKGNRIVLMATGSHGMYERLNADGEETGNFVNLKTSLQCGALYTEAQHERYLAKKAKWEKKG